ncbi:unnamed protein product [Closterium sp. NIES-65]|nr:unnamed protein product [Closterium sp. NIES-65]
MGPGHMGPGHVVPGHVVPGHVVPGHVHCRPIVSRPESKRGHACSEQEGGRRSEHEQGSDTAPNAPCHALCRVPMDVLEGCIAPHLAASDLCAMAAVCRCWHRMASSDSLWQQRCESTFPCHPPIAASGGNGGGEGRGDRGGGNGGEAARWKGLFGALALARAQWGGRVVRLVARGVDCSSEWGEWRVQGIGCGGDGGIWCSEVEVGFSPTSFHYTSPPIRLSSDWLQPHSLALPPAALVAGSHLRIHLTGLSPLTACQPAGGSRDGGEEEGRRERGDGEGGGGEEEAGEEAGEDGMKQFVCFERVEVFAFGIYRYGVFPNLLF